MNYYLIGQTMLHEAAYWGNTRAAQQLISSGADINLQDSRYGKYCSLIYNIIVASPLHM